MNPAQKVLAHAMTEAELLQQVENLAHFHGWLKTYHTWNSRHSQAGWPDLVILRNGRLLAVELKSQAGRMTKAQTEWLGLLETVPGIDTYVWRPNDLLSGAIEQALK